MMKLRLTLCVLASILILGSSVSSSSANPLWPGYFELMDRPYSLDVAPAGSVWHAVASSDQAGDGGWFVTQVGFYDHDGNSLISNSDRILGSGQMIVVVTPSRLYRVEGLDWVLRPQLEIPGGPVGETWEVIDPDTVWGTTVAVEDWTDVMPEGPSVGDAVWLDGGWHEIVQISLCVEGAQGVPVRSTTWSRIKALFMDGR